MLSIIILAAGQGTRMQSELPKVLHRLAGKTLLEHVYTAASGLEHRKIHIVYGYGGRQVPDTLSSLQADWVEQPQQLGTGHAVTLALPSVPDGDNVLLLFGDVPLVTLDSLQRLVSAAGTAGFGLMTAEVDDPAGYGRIIRDDKGRVTRIVEEKDATDPQRAVRELNTGIMLVRAALLKDWLADLRNRNAQGEYYLTDVIEKAALEKVDIRTIKPVSTAEIQGVNNRVQLAALERYYQQKLAHNLMRDGVTLMDPSRFDVRGELSTGRDILIDVNVVIEGRVRIGDNVSIGANCYISNSDIADGVAVLQNCVIENAVIGCNCRIGPFARIRPQTRLADEVHVGNFVELKKAEVGAGSKINHLSYVGDCEIGTNANIGAGTITCNFDGANKHLTRIGNNVFIGSDSQLVAPVVIGDGATIGAGTTVIRDVESGILTFTKAEQKVVRDWQRPVKKQP